MKKVERRKKTIWLRIFLQLSSLEKQKAIHITILGVSSSRNKFYNKFCHVKMPRTAESVLANDESAFHPTYGAGTVSHPKAHVLMLGPSILGGSGKVSMRLGGSD